MLVKNTFNGAEIYTLIGKINLSKKEKALDNALGFFTDLPFGTPELINSIKHLNKEFYLVNQAEKQFLVVVTNEFIETHQMIIFIDSDQFDVENWHFIKCKHPLK